MTDGMVCYDSTARLLHGLRPAEQILATRAVYDDPWAFLALTPARFGRRWDVVTQVWRGFAFVDILFTSSSQLAEVFR